MFQKRLLVRALALGMLGLGAAQAGDIYVQQSVGNDANTGTAWGAGNALATIRKGLELAIDIAHPGPDTIHVAAGTYRENLEFSYPASGNDTTLLGSYPASGAGPRNRSTTPSIIDGSDVGIVIKVSGVNNLVLDRFVIQHGNADNKGDPNKPNAGGGVYFGYDNSNVTLSNNLIQNNVAPTLGGGIAGGGGGPFVNGLKLLNNVIRNNQARTGGGVYLGGGTTAQVLNNQIRDNQASDGNGGGLAMVNAETQALLRGNRSSRTAQAPRAGAFTTRKPG